MNVRTKQISLGRKAGITFQAMLISREETEGDQCARLGGELVTRVRSTKVKSEGLGREEWECAIPELCTKNTLSLIKDQALEHSAKRV